jgi:glutamate carboxypeptidase
MTSIEKVKTYRNDPLQQAVAASESRLMDRIRRLVEIESPSDDKPSVDRCTEAVADLASSLGAKVRRHRQRAFGDVLELRFEPARRKKNPAPVMLLGHLDTVWPLGTLSGMPFRIAKGRAWGPGVLDMKAGVVMGLTAIEALCATDTLERPAVFLLNGDEEIGSTVSRPITEKLARRCAAVFVLEPAQGLDGAYKTARKGVGDYTLRVKGVAAHAGVDFQKGHSAIHELAWQLEKVRGFTELDRGLTVNAGVIRGGHEDERDCSRSRGGDRCAHCPRKRCGTDRAEVSFSARSRPLLRPAGGGWDESAADGTQPRHGRAFSARRDIRCGDGVLTGGSRDGRWFRR